MTPTGGRTSVALIAVLAASSLAVGLAPSAAVTAAEPGGVDLTVARVTAVESVAPAARVSAVDSVATASARPLSGLVIAVDPGHQLGNANPRFARYMRQTRWNGYSNKACNTTGTSTNAGYPEATFTWNVSLRLKAKLEALGATVRMTRTVNSYNAWGPCTWDRGTFGRRVGAALEVSVHADGAAPSGRGFYIIAPGYIRGWTDDVYARAQRLAVAMKAGMAAAGATPSTYIKGGIWTTKEMTGLNFSDVPTVIVENGNMRNSREAALMSSARGHEFYANALLRGIRTYLRR